MMPAVHSDQPYQDECFRFNDFYGRTFYVDAGENVIKEGRNDANIDVFL